MCAQVLAAVHALHDGGEGEEGEGAVGAAVEGHGEEGAWKGSGHGSVAEGRAHTRGVEQDLGHRLKKES